MKILYRLSCLFIFVVCYCVLTACGGGGGGAGADTSTSTGTGTGTGTASSQPLIADAVQNLDVMATGSGTMASKSQQIVVTDPQNQVLSYTLSSLPSKGSAAITSGGVLTYAISTLTNATTDNLSVLVSSGTRSVTIAVPVAITTDSLAIQASDQSLNVEAFGLGVISKTLQIHARDPQNQSLSYAVTTAPTSGSASVSNAGLLTYSVTAPTTATSDSVQVTVSNGTKSRVISVLIGIDRSVNADPLLNWQWHLVNQNQYFSSTNPAANAGCDLNIHPSASRTCGGVSGTAGTNLWASGIKGNNVNVTVVDTGLELAHEDLAANIVSGGSYNFNTFTANPTNTATTGDHGTSVAGLIAGVANNGVGISGVAPKAKLRGYNYLVSSQSTSQFATAFGANSAYGSFQTDIFNYSAGSESATLYAPSTASDAVYLNAANNLRAGKGALVVKSAGNSFGGMYDSLGLLIGSSVCLTSGVSCQNANSEDDKTVYSNIVVAAVTAAGKKTTYSNAGSPIWVSGFGGQSAYDTAVYGTGLLASAPSSYEPAMVTTDQAGCLAGYVRSGSTNRNLLDMGTGTGMSNASCSYTGRFNGTSAAAPTVSGVIALMLQVNPNLTWRDVRHILATTARKISPTQATVTNTTYFLGNTLTLEQGWVTNAAGFNFHNYFGFGLVDATAAVNAAKTYVLGSLGTFLSRTASASLVATNVSSASGLSGLTKTFAMSGLGKVEQAELMFYPSSTYTPYCTQIELISPSNTKSILLNMDSGHTGVTSLSTVSGTRFLSNAFYGENASGTWTLRFINRCATTQSLSSIYPQQLTLRGR